MLEEEERPKSLPDSVLESLSREELIEAYKQVDKYRAGLEERERKNLTELGKLKNIILMNYVTAKQIEIGVSHRSGTMCFN